MAAGTGAGSAQTRSEADADQPTVWHRAYIGAEDAHYGGGLVDGARILKLFGDAATELSIRLDGDEGLLAAYEQVDFHQPTRAGDFVEVQARLLSRRRRSRRIGLTAHGYIESSGAGTSASVVLDEPVLVCEAVLVAVVPEASSAHQAAP